MDKFTVLGADTPYNPSEGLVKLVCDTGYENGNHPYSVRVVTPLDGLLSDLSPTEVAKLIARLLNEHVANG